MMDSTHTERKKRDLQDDATTEYYSEPFIRRKRSKSKRKRKSRSSDSVEPPGPTDDSSPDKGRTYCIGLRPLEVNDDSAKPKSGGGSGSADGSGSGTGSGSGGGNGDDGSPGGACVKLHAMLDYLGIDPKYVVEGVPQSGSGSGSAAGTGSATAQSKKFI